MKEVREGVLFRGRFERVPAAPFEAQRPVGSPFLDLAVQHGLAVHQARAIEDEKSRYFGS